MKKYTKIWLDYMRYDGRGYMPCECTCGRQIIDVHHLVPKSLDKSRINDITNLIGLSRVCHDRAHKDRAFNEMLKLIVKKRHALILIMAILLSSCTPHWQVKKGGYTYYTKKWHR